MDTIIEISAQNKPKTIVEHTTESPNTMVQCCLSGFTWNGTPTGKETKLANNDTYVSGTNNEVAILMIHDIFGWTFTNLRLLADHFAQEANATVYLPDFFGGEVVIPSMLEAPEKAKNFDHLDFVLGRNGKAKRFPEIVACAQALKAELGFQKVGAIGYCYGGWAVFQLGAKGQNLVDCISAIHPSALTEAEIDAVAVPVQVQASEHDGQFTGELKAYCNSVIPGLGVEYEYHYFPVLCHGWAVRGDQDDELQRRGLERAKNAAGAFFVQFLHRQ